MAEAHRYVLPACETWKLYHIICVLVPNGSAVLEVNLCFDTEYKDALVAVLDSDELIMVEEEQAATWILVVRIMRIW